MYKERLKQTFSSLRHRNYLLLWIGDMISHTGDFMDHIAFNWLILEITNSPLSLGLVNLFRAIPVLILTPLGGVAADRWERRRILVVTQSGAMVLAFLLGALVTTGWVNIWEIYIIAALRGSLMSFNMPARQSMLSNLVPREDLPNAIALNSATMNLTRILGPSLGGILIALFGIDWLFYINGLSFLAILWTLRCLRGVETGGGKGHANPWWELKEGFVFLGRHKLLRYLVILAVVPLFFGQPYMTMLTVFARDVLKIGPVGLGMLTSTASLGSVCGALLVAASRRGPRISFMLGGLMLFGMAILLFSFSPWVVTSLLFLFLAGASSMTYSSTNNTLLQLNVPDAYRGRILSLLFINRGMIPMGTALAGFLAENLGAPIALGSMATALMICAGIAIFLRPKAPLSP